MTNRQKIYQLLEQMERYNDYLASGEFISFQDRVAISKEIVRLSNIQEYLTGRPMIVMDKEYPEYEIEKPSTINEKEKVA